MSVRLDLHGVANLRDLGGLQRTDGSTTPFGVFLRSEKLDRLTNDDWQRLRDYGVTTVIDLRQPHERVGEVPEDIDVIHTDLDGDDREFWEPLIADGRWGTPLYYTQHMNEFPERMASVLDAVNDAREGTVLFHCIAGWDRTGSVAAVLLRALGVTTEAATKDYAQSFANADAMGEVHGRSFEAPARIEILRRFSHTPESAFESVYEQIDLASWFEHAGVSPEIRDVVGTWRGTVPLSV